MVVQGSMGQTVSEGERVSSLLRAALLSVALCELYPRSVGHTQTVRQGHSSLSAQGLVQTKTQTIHNLSQTYTYR